MLPTARPSPAGDGGLSWRAPTWITLPVALHAAWSDPAADEPEPVMLDVLWGQYALFLAVRLQDDLLDRHHGDLRLQFVADRFLVESLQALQPLPQLDASFWMQYRHWLRDTTDAILEVDHLCRTPGAFTAAHLPLHGKVGAIFRVGGLAICRLCVRPWEAAWLGALQQQLSVFSQIVDDLDDAAEDLRAGRYTFVVNTLTGARPDASAEPADYQDRLRASWLDPVRMDPIWSEMERLAARVAALVPRSAPAQAHAVAAGVQRTMTGLQERMHTARVAHVFGREIAALKPACEAGHPRSS